MSTSSSATSTEFLTPEQFGGRAFFSHKKNFTVLLITLTIISLIMWAVSPGIGILGLSFVVIYAIAGLSLNYQAGVTGIINIGVVGFFAIGAYSVSLASLLGWNWFPALIIAVLFTSLITWLSGKSLLSLREDYFAIITITLGEIIRFIFQKEGWIVYPPSQAAYWGGTKGLSPGNAMRQNLTVLNIFNFVSVGLANGVAGIFKFINTVLIDIGIPGSVNVYIGIPNWYIVSLNLNVANLFLLQPIDAQNIVFLIAMTILLVISYVVFERIYNSPLGRLNKAIREDDLAAESTGEDVFNRKVHVFVLGNVLIAISGGLYAYFLSSISPEAFLPLFTFYVWAVVVLGGIANNRGSIFGAVIFGASIPIFATIELKDKIQGLFGSFMKPFIPSVIGIFTNFIDPGISTATTTFKIDLTWLLNLIIEPIYNFNVFGVLIPLSTLVFFIIAVVFVLLKGITLADDTKLKVLTENSVTSKIFDVLLVLFVGLFVTNFIITPPMTFIIDLQLNDLFLLTTIALIVLILLVAFNVIPITDHSQEDNLNWYVQTFLLDRGRVLKILGIIFALTVIPVIFTKLDILPQIIFDSYNSALGVKFVPISTFFTTLDPEYARIMLVGITIMVFLMFKPEGVLKEQQIRTVDSIGEYEIYYNSHASKEDVDLDLQKAELPFYANESSDLLNTKELTKNFGGVVGLNKVSVAVKRGSLLGIIGPNGSGKSTFFNVLTGLLDQDKNEEGRIEFLNRDVTYLSISERARLGMGRTFQQSRLFRNMTVLENVLVSAKNQQGTKLKNVLLGNWIQQERELHQQAFQILQYLNILHIWNHKASDISGGQQKLVALARALISNSHIILLDEPVAGVNPTLAKKIFEKIQELHQSGKQNFVIIEHNMDVQLGFCDQIIVFNKGQVVAEGTPDEIRSNKDVLDAYLGH